MAQRLCYFFIKQTQRDSPIWCASNPVERAGCASTCCFILHPLFWVPVPHYVCVCVCLMPFIPRHGTGCALRSGEVFRSQIPCEKTLFPSVQKQVSGLPCWDRVYVSVSLSCRYVRYDKQHEVHACWDFCTMYFFSFAPHLVFITIKSFIHIPKSSVICF